MMSPSLHRVKLIFAQGKHPYSKAIRLRYQSKWSHVGIIIDGYVHEAVDKAGVIKTPLPDFLNRYETVSTAYAYAEEGWEERANNLLGTPYDWWGAFGMGFGTRKLDDPNKLCCSHHVALVLGTIRPERVLRISPEHIWMFSKN